ncbi:hypothetical protein [Planobispora rosea]|uniref:hypothetical protein n=1 Tax=Planobispora rosea TaxID=35762 RepID=UPI00083A0269|nr:hypothetical protein [Planobispora rosea]
MRIQVLTLPSVVVGDDVEEPFALVVDQVHDRIRDEVEGEKWRLFRDQCGARALLVTSETVEIVDPYAAAPEDPSLSALERA